MPDQLTPATFEPHLDTSFSTQIGDGIEILMVLDTVQRHAPRSHGGRAEPFSLLFSRTPGAPIPQATYSLAHPELGVLDIFIVPIGPDETGRQRYEAVFN